MVVSNVLFAGAPHILSVRIQVDIGAAEVTCAPHIRLLHDMLLLRLAYLQPVRVTSFLLSRICNPLPTCGRACPQCDRRSCRRSGLPQRHLLEACAILRFQVSRLISETFSEMIFTFGDVHCDPHAGNLRLIAHLQ